MKVKLISLLVILFASTTNTFAAESASQLLERAAKTISTAPCVSAKYSLITTDGSKSAGAITISGNRFLMDAGQMKVWYDGKTQWSYNTAAAEVNITEPSATELQQINPLLIIQSFKTNYTVNPIKATPKDTTITLDAKNPNADIPTVILTLNTKTSLPSEITIKMASGQSVSIRINSISVGKKLSDSSFRFQPSNYPGVELIDLR